MGLFLLAIVVILVVVWVFTRRRAGSTVPGSNERQALALNRGTPRLASPLSSGDYPDTGPVTAAPDGGWILNPKSTFPLTVYGIDLPTAQQLKSLLDRGYFLSTDEQAKTLVPLFVRFNLRCKEVDEYMRKFKPRYFKRLEQLKRSSPEWASASELDREDLLVGFRQLAIDSLEVRPGVCDLAALFETEPQDASLDDALIDRFGFENLEFYFRYAGNVKKVHKIPAHHRDRERFERLAKAGLAVRGEDVPLSDILRALSLKELQQLVADLESPKFRKKADAINFLMSLPDIRARLTKVLAFRELFQLSPLPPEFSHINLERISASWYYAYQVAMLVAHTYIAAGEATSKQREYEGDVVAGWELLCDEDCCTYCKGAAAKAYSNTQRPKVPFHIGCRCMVVPKL
jgi:hypothetical protein